jgi:hypothetical protein
MRVLGFVLGVKTFSLSSKSFPGRPFHLCLSVFICGFKFHYGRSRKPRNFSSGMKTSVRCGSAFSVRFRESLDKVSR